MTHGTACTALRLNVCCVYGQFTNEWLPCDNGVDAVEANKPALNHLMEGHFIRPNGVTSISVRQARAPLLSTIIVRALRKWALARDVNVLQVNTNKCASNYDGELYVSHDE